MAPKCSYDVRIGWILMPMWKPKRIKIQFNGEIKNQNSRKIKIHSNLIMYFIICEHRYLHYYIMLPRYDLLIQFIFTLWFILPYIDDHSPCMLLNICTSVLCYLFYEFYLYIRFMFYEFYWTFVHLFYVTHVFNF